VDWCVLNPAVGREVAPQTVAPTLPISLLAVVAGRLICVFQDTI